MTRAVFSKEQPEVTVVSIDGKDFFYICLNGEEKTDSETGDNYFEYDYNEIICPKGELDIEDVKADPEKYLNYTHEEAAELSVEEQINDVQLALAELYEMMLGE